MGWIHHADNVRPSRNTRARSMRIVRIYTTFLRFYFFPVQLIPDPRSFEKFSEWSSTQYGWLLAMFGVRCVFVCVRALIKSKNREETPIGILLLKLFKFRFVSESRKYLRNFSGHFFPHHYFVMVAQFGARLRNIRSAAYEFQNELIDFSHPPSLTVSHPHLCAQLSRIISFLAPQFGFHSLLLPSHQSFNIFIPNKPYPSFSSPSRTHTLQFEFFSFNMRDIHQY